MIHGKKVVVVMPVYNAQNTLGKTHAETPFEFVDEVILVDDQAAMTPPRSRKSSAPKL